MSSFNEGGGFWQSRGMACWRERPFRASAKRSSSSTYLQHSLQPSTARIVQVATLAVFKQGREVCGLRARQATICVLKTKSAVVPCIRERRGLSAEGGQALLTPGGCSKCFQFELNSLIRPVPSTSPQVSECQPQAAQSCRHAPHS